MNAIISYNRKTLDSVKQWILYEDWTMPPSLFNYGLPSHVFHLIDKPINNDVSEVDYLCHLMSTMTCNNHSIRYLEIGVSVGKNLYTVVQYLKGLAASSHRHTVTGIDIEKINPILQNLLASSHTTHKTETFINTKPTSIRNCTTNVCTQFDDTTLSTRYYEADEFSSVWTHLADPFNLVFSDALHDPRALMHEYFSLKENNLLDTVNGFFYCFDDLEADDKTGQMWGAVRRIVSDMTRTFITLDIRVKHLEMNAWLGQHEHKHHFGVITATLKS